MESQYRQYIVLYCEKCYKGILKKLEDSVEMSINVNSCNTFQHSTKLGQVYYIEEITGKLFPHKWKFTNDSRRKIIKGIKASISISE